ncbi:hypothetical protein [Marinobacter sp.]|uniref:hypothetical protein n=1 Tax=Marinobacter sp. TaxID=50741 RepID=UPI003A8D2718
MIDHLTKLRARKAANDYRTGQQLKREASQLSVSKLAAKFEVGEHTILRAIDNMPCERLSDEEAALVRMCHGEYNRLSRRAERLTFPALANHYNVTKADIQIELDLSGYVSPFKREAVPA